MTYTKNNNSSAYITDENQVVDFLTSHPGFLNKHKEILDKIDVSHGYDGNVASLIERQVSMLREQNKGLSQVIEEYQSRYEKGINNFKTINTLSERLVETETLADFYRLFKQKMLDLYATNQVKLYLFIDEEYLLDIEGMPVLKRDANLRPMFTELLNRNKPLCGSLQAEHMISLFNKSADKIRSTVIVPLKCKNWEGLLVLGSQHKDQYSHGVELELLVSLSKLLTLCIQKELESI